MVAMSDIQQFRGEILRIAGSHGAHDVRLFGSVVRDESTASSDLDLLVRFDPDRSLLDQIALKQELEDLLSCRVDVVEDDSLYRSVRKRILAEAIEL